MNNSPTSAPDPPRPVVAARPVRVPAYAPRPPGRSSVLELHGLSRRAAALDLALVLLVLVVAPFGPSIAAAYLTREVPVPEVGVLMVLIKWSQVLLALGVAGYLMLRHGIHPASFGMNVRRLPVQVGWGVAAVVPVYVSLIGTSLWVLALCELFPQLRGDVVQRFEFVQSMPVGNLPLSVVLLVAVAMHEEVLFRGLLLPLLRRLSGRWWVAVLLSSCIFAALHAPQQGLLGAAQILVVGAVLAIVFIASRSLLAVTVAHFLFNFAQFQLLRLAEPWLRELSESF